MSDSFFDELLQETQEQNCFGDFKPGAKIDRYKIISSIGAGGMGIVFKAEDAHTQQIVAIKVILQNRLTSLSRKRFLQEVEVSGQLDHGNIIKVIKAGSFKEHIFLVMEYVAGFPLDEYCRHKQLTLEEKIRLFMQICKAMGHAHKRKVIHRDLKPENIMITDEGQVKVMDFGLAKLTEGKKFQLTKSQEIMGSPRYMSPEQAKGDRNVDARTDVYALGAILYEILTGEQMMPGDTLMEILYNIQRQNYAKRLIVNEVNAPKNIELIWKKSVAKKNSRYANAGELYIALQQYLQQKNFSPLQRVMQRFVLHLREFLILSIIAVIAAIYVVFSQMPQKRQRIHLPENLKTLQNLVDRKLFDAAQELIAKLRDRKLNRQKLQLLTLQVQNAKGLHYDVYNTVVAMDDDDITPEIALEQIQALIHMNKHELCGRYLSRLEKINRKYNREALSSKLIVYFYQKKYREVLNIYKVLGVTGENLDVFLGCSYLEIYNAIVACEKKIYDLTKKMNLLRESKKHSIQREIDDERKLCKELLIHGAQNVAVQKSPPRKIGTKTVVLTNAYKIFKSVKDKHRNILFYEGFAKTNIFLHKETKVNRYLANAQKYLHQATIARPKNYDYLILLGQVYSQRKFYQKAYLVFEKAIALSNNNVKALDAIMRLPLEDSRYQERIFWSIFRSFGTNFKTSKPDLLRENIENIKLQNAHYYEAWRSNRYNKSDIKQICELFSSATEYAQELATKMLVLKSYSYPLHKVDDYASRVAQHIPRLSLLQNNDIREKFYTARKKVVYYQLADFYLHRKELPNTESFQKDVESLLLNSEEHILIRYLAAKMLVQKSDSLLISHYNDRDDVELALVSSCALIEEGLIIDLNVLLAQNMRLDTLEKTLLYTRLFRIDNKYYELFLKRYRPQNAWRNLEVKINKSTTLTKDILAVAGILWWQADVKMPHHRAGEILRDAMNSKDKIFAAYAHHFYWISPHVYTTLNNEYLDQYYGWLRDKNVDASCKLQMLNSNRFYTRINDTYFFDTLGKLAIEGSSTVRLKATYILADRQPYSREYVRIVNRTSLPNAQRTLAYVSGVIGQLQKLVKNKQKGKYDEVISQIRSLYHQLMENKDDDAFKSFIYKVTAFLGFRSLRQLREYEYSPSLKANIIMNLCSDPMLPETMLPFVSGFLKVSHDSNTLLKTTLSNYESPAVPNVIRSIAASYSFLGEKAPRKDDKVWKAGFAWGKYRKLRQTLMLKETGFYERIRAASSSYYDLYLQKLTKNKHGNEKKPQQIFRYIKQLKVALSFAQQDVFRSKYNYELSILYHAMSRLVKEESKAQKFLHLAEAHIEKSLKQIDLPLEYKMRYELQWAYVKSETSISQAHAAIEKYLPLNRNPVFFDVMLACLKNHSGEKSKLLYREILYKKLLLMAKFRFINDDDNKKAYSKIREIHLLLQKVSRDPSFHQMCYEILQTYLKLEND
ncbi:serine/threonine protein kinase [Candidatus Uabimicrobium amorphum]|uniref:Protein kinase n=1 Tax=Uabimicrobium amorphum TaxID=2596890 RepID=A0A5S9IIA8_UABAM|nr:serine/threonine-protein kinase [Candidatus Uabimicrobium amorphum]BBM81986.1 protein kinase [Candidatus Uabimicrobium amorphum]